MMLDGSDTSIRTAFEVLNDFGELFGLRINKEKKTSAFWLGKSLINLDRKCPELDLNWTKDFDLLGLYMCNKVAKTMITNYTRAI